MPVGIIINALSVFAGGIVGAVFGRLIQERLKAGLNMVFSVCASGMGIGLLTQGENTTPLVS